jgi:predicted PurR-regulated permease PerM
MPNASLEAIRRAVTFAASVLFIAVLYWGRELLIPLAVAILLSFLLRPLIKRLMSWHVPHVLAVLFATLLSAGIVVGMVFLLSAQVVDLTSKLPDYQQNLTHKTAGIRDLFGSKLSRLNNTLKSVKSDLATTQEASPATLPLQLQVKPAASDSEWDFMSVASDVVNPLLVPITQTGVVFILLLFLLMDFDLAGRRLHWAEEHWRLGVPIDAVEEALSRVGRYLRAQLIINICYGVVIAIALYMIGVPNALLWGVLATLLRYVPYIGPWIAAALPIALSIAVFEGWTRVFVVTAVFIVVESITNGILEPMLYGHSTGVSSIGVVLATFFWGWLWGPVGLILAMPMTACLVVIGRHIPLLRTLSVMLSSDTIEAASPTGAVDSSKPLDVTSFILKMR